MLNIVIPALALVAAPAAYNVCIDDRAFLESSAETMVAPVCEAGLSMGYHLYEDDADQPPLRAVSPPRRVQAKKVPKVKPIANVVQPSTREPMGPEPAEGPYLRISGGRSDLDELAIEDIELPQVEDSYARAEIDFPEGEAIAFDDLDEVSEESTWYGEGYHTADRLVNVMLSQTIPPGRLQMIILHRATTPFSRAPVRDLLGFDAGMKIGLGLRLGVIEGIDVGVLRVNGVAEPFDVYEYDVRYQIFEGEDTASALRVGLSTFFIPGSLSSGWFVLLGTERRLWERLLINVNTSFHANTTAPNKREDDVDGSCNLGAGFELRIADWFAVSADIMHTMLGYARRYPSAAAAIKFYSHRHTFAIVTSNTPYTTMDGLLANSTGGEFNDLLLGFNITREFDLWEN